MAKHDVVQKLIQKLSRIFRILDNDLSLIDNSICVPRATFIFARFKCYFPISDENMYQAW